MSIQKINKTGINLAASIVKNKTVLKTLEKISEHGTSFAAGTSLFMSLAVRPLAIRSTPDVEKENKQYTMANSICSGIMKFAMVEAVALPIENAVKNIDKNPENFLKKLTITNLKNTQPALIESKSYKLITQIIKLSTGFLTAVPKSILTIALIPIFMDNLFSRKKGNKKEETEKHINQRQNYGKDISFNGSERISKVLAKIIDNKSFQNFAIKYQNKDKDIAKHMTAAADIMLTSTSVYRTSKSNEIKENRKKALIYNNIISTAVTILGGYGIDSIIKNKTGRFIENFKQINAKDPKLYKYIEGINILRPALIFAAVYYCILPMFSTYTAEKIDKYIVRHSNKQTRR